MGALRSQVVRSGVLAVTLCAASSHAQESWVRIEYTAPPECPSEADFIEQVLIRTRRARLAGPGDLAHTLKITIESQPGQSVARLEFVDTDSQRVKREVSGEECGEVVSGIALVTAIAIDARAEKQAAQAPPARPPSERAKPRADPPEAAPVPRARTEPGGTGARWDVGLGILTTSAVAPSLLYGLDAFVAVGPRNARWSARLTLAYLESPNLNVARGEARFQLAFARAEACPLALRPTAHLALLPCAAFDAGVVAASGGGVPEPNSPKAFWSGVSFVARMQLDLQDFLLFEVQGELGTPFTRERFYFEDPEVTAHEVDEVRWGAGAAIGVRF
jgi:hypothetical protein